MTVKELTKLFNSFDVVGLSDYDVVIKGDHETVETVSINFIEQNIEIWGE